MLLVWLRQILFGVALALIPSCTSYRVHVWIASWPVASSSLKQAPLSLLSSGSHNCILRITSTEQHNTLDKCYIDTYPLPTHKTIKVELPVSCCITFCLCINSLTWMTLIDCYINDEIIRLSRPLFYEKLLKAVCPAQHYLLALVYEHLYLMVTDVGILVT